MPKQKLYPVTKDNRDDGVFERPPQNDSDEFGKRKVNPSGPRKKVSKAGAMGKDDNAEGMPGAKSSVEDEAFKKANDRIQKLKSGDQDHEF